MYKTAVHATNNSKSLSLYLWTGAFTSSQMYFIYGKNNKLSELQGQPNCTRTKSQGYIIADKVPNYTPKCLEIQWDCHKRKNHPLTMLNQVRKWKYALHTELLVESSAILLSPNYSIQFRIHVPELIFGVQNLVKMNCTGAYYGQRKQSLLLIT